MADRHEESARRAKGIQPVHGNASMIDALPDSVGTDRLRTDIKNSQRKKQHRSKKPTRSCQSHCNGKTRDEEGSYEMISRQAAGQVLFAAANPRFFIEHPGEGKCPESRKARRIQGENAHSSQEGTKAIDREKQGIEHARSMTLRVPVASRSPSGAGCRSKTGCLRRR